MGRSLLVAWAIGAGWLGPSAAQTPAPVKVLRKPTMSEDLQMFSQVLNQIRVNHPDSIDAHRLIMAAIEGMVRAADPHSYVLPVTRLSPEKATELQDGKLFPIPIDFRFVGGTPVVAAVQPGSKAERADILPGDELVAVDGEAVTALSAAELTVSLAGAKNSIAKLTLARQRADGTTLEVGRDVRRERIDDEGNAVPVVQMLDQQTGYIRITTFNNSKVADQLHDAVGLLKKAGMRRLVLDLRDNGGGLVRQAAEVAGEFLPAGAIVYTAETKKDKPDTVRVKRSFWKSEDRYPIVAMVDDGTASASELVAGALQDHDRAVVVGRPSFGKSLMMQGMPLLDGSTIVLVIGRIRTPCGRIVQREYRSLTRRDYYRLAAADRDTVGRASCTTAAGRRVFGGGGIYPDVMMPAPAAAPTWLAKILEEELPLKWAGAYLSETSLPTSVDSLLAKPEVLGGAVANFRKFAVGRNFEIPAGEDVDHRLLRVLTLELAAVKWGDSGYYRVVAAGDPAVAEAVKHFDMAAKIGR